MISRQRLWNANKKAKRRIKSFGEWGKLNWRNYRKVTCFCSNPCCCGNSRKLGLKTIQELKADAAFKDDL
jgi:hypothetical protein